MATLADDFRFQRPRAGYGSGRSGYEGDEAGYGHGDDGDDEEEEEDPLFGDGGAAGGANGSSYRSYFSKGTFEDKDDDRKGNAKYALPPRDNERQRRRREGQARDATSGPSSDENSELYAVLNLEKDASNEDVLKSYRTLAVAFHPDKHQNPELKQAAQARFEQVQHAYEVLSDPHKRAVYDLLGEEGLKSSWEVGQKVPTPEEIRAEYEKHKLKRAQAEIENLIRSRTEVSIGLDASRQINSEQVSSNTAEAFLTALTSLASSDVRQIFMKASTASVLTPSTIVTYSGTMLARGGRGGGNLQAVVKHQYNPKVSIEAGTTLMQPKAGTLKVNYAPNGDTFFNVETSARGFATQPPINATYGTRLTSRLTGFMKLGTGTGYTLLGLLPHNQNAAPSTFTVGVASSAYSVDLTMDGYLQTQVSANYGGIRLFPSSSGNKGGSNGQHGNRPSSAWKVSVNTAVATGGGLQVGISTDKRLTTNTYLNLGIGVAVNSGALTLRVRLSRLGQKITVPILLSQHASPRLILGTIVVPALSITTLQYFYLSPRKRRRIEEKMRNMREEMREENAQKRKEANEAAALLREQIERKREQERAKDGLVVLSAMYSGSEGSSDAGETLDVTIPLQALVASSTANGSTLTIPGGRSKAGIIGFYDVSVGGRKRLAVEYSFRGRRHEAVFGDYQAVALPMRAHLVE